MPRSISPICARGAVGRPRTRRAGREYPRGLASVWDTAVPSHSGVETPNETGETGRNLVDTWRLYRRGGSMGAIRLTKN